MFKCLTLVCIALMWVATIVLQCIYYIARHECLKGFEVKTLTIFVRNLVGNGLTD